MKKIIAPNKDSYIFNIRDDKTIYLGIQTNIICINDRPKYFKNFFSYMISDFFNFHDTVATLYLGKITFEDKQGIKIPKYIPSKITESSFEGLNLFWLNEMNPNPEIPNRPMVTWTTVGLLPDIRPEDYKYLKVTYFRTSQNIILNKEQIISYFTELHTSNTNAIKTYIDTINKEGGIRGYYLSTSHFNEAIKLGLLPQMEVSIASFGHFYDRTQNAMLTNEHIMIALDYLKQTNQHRIIPYFDELFYAYLVWSLREYLIPYDVLKYQEKLNYLFNLGAYKDYAQKANQDIAIDMPGELDSKLNQIELFYDNIIPTKYAKGYIEGYERFFAYYGHNNYNNIHWLKELPKSRGYQFSSPNNKLSDTKKFIPSPLGNYYFELKENKHTFIQFYPRIYPSITKPPKGWTKEMMKKLELQLDLDMYKP